MPTVSQFGWTQEFEVADVLSFTDFAGFATTYENAGVDDEGATFSVPTPDGLPPASVGCDISRDHKKIIVQVAARFAENLLIDDLERWQHSPDCKLVAECCYNVARQFQAYLRFMHGNSFVGELGCDRI